MPHPTLYLIATPLGNLEDLSQRAARCLAEVSTIYAEDTRRPRVLVEHLGLKRRLRSLHEHNERSRGEEVAEMLERGNSVALLTDAGTPAVSDPGAELVRQIAEHGFRVSPIPGPSALTAAISVSGFAMSELGALFLGFLPPRGRDRREALGRVAAHCGLVVLFESPVRLSGTLRDLVDLDGDRPACLSRELTKVHEEVRHGTVAGLLGELPEEVRGEITLVLGPRIVEQTDPAQQEIDAALTRCLDAGLSARDAAAAVAAVMQLSKRSIYSRCQQIVALRSQ